MNNENKIVLMFSFNYDFSNTLKYIKIVKIFDENPYFKR